MLKCWTVPEPSGLNTEDKETFSCSGIVNARYSCDAASVFGHCEPSDIEQMWRSSWKRWNVPMILRPGSCESCRVWNILKPAGWRPRLEYGRGTQSSSWMMNDDPRINHGSDTRKGIFRHQGPGLGRILKLHSPLFHGSGYWSRFTSKNNNMISSVLFDSWTICRKMLK